MRLCNVMGLRMSILSRRVAVALVCIVTVLTINDECQAKRIPRHGEKHIGAANHRWMLVAKLTAGMLVGGASDLIDEQSNRLQDKVVYGADLELVFVVHPNLQVGVVAEAVWKFDHDRVIKAMKATSYGLSTLYSFRPITLSSYFIRAEFGTATERRPSVTPGGGDYDGGTHPYMRLGAGHLFWHSSRVAMRVELYYKRGFTRGYTPDASWIDMIDFDVAYFGLSLDISYSLW